MAEDPVEALERQVHQLTREVAHEQQMRGFLGDRMQRLESSVHGKMSRAEVISWGWALLPLVIGAALLISLVVAARTHAPCASGARDGRPEAAVPVGLVVQRRGRARRRCIEILYY